MSADTIKIAVRKFAPFETALQKLWGGYCEATGCRLRAELAPMDLDDLHRATLEDKGLKNGEWDIAHIVTDWLLEAWQDGALEDLQPYIAQNPPQDLPAGWSNSLLSMQRFGAAIAGLPFHDGPECLIYRKDLFEDSREQQAFYHMHGKCLEAPKTWQDFITAARFFHRPGQNLYGTVIAGLPDGHNTVFDFCLQLWSRGGSITNSNGDVQINTAPAIEGLAFYRELLRDKSAIHPNTMQYESVQAGMAFARGEAALMVNWFGFASMCEVLDGCAVKGMVDIAPVPCTSGNEPASLNVYWLYAIGAGSRHKQTGAAFLHDFLKGASATGRRKTGIIAAMCVIWLAGQALGAWHWLTIHLTPQALQSAEVFNFLTGAFIAGCAYHLLYSRNKNIDKYIPYLSMFGIVYFTTVTTAAGRANLLHVGLLLFLVSVIHNGAGYFFGYWLSRLFKLDKNSARTIAFEVGLQNGGMASGLAGTMGKLATVGLAAAVFSPWMNISGSILANYWRRRPVEKSDDITQNPGKPLSKSSAL